MSTTLTNGLKLPDKGSVDWYADMQNNYAILDGAVGTVAEHTTALAGKAPAVHTHTKSDVTDLLNSNFIPSANNSYDLGSSSYQWNNLYAKNYYYNGTQWGLDQANTWTNDNTFKGIYQNQGDENFIIPRGTNTVKGDLTTSGGFTLMFKDKNNGSLATSGIGYFSIKQISSGSYATIGVETIGSTDNARHTNSISLKIDPSTNDNTAQFYPVYNNSTYLGTSTNKWKTLNGVNPGALSLPDYSSAANIDTTNWNTNGTLTSYTPTMNGWLQITLPDDADNNGKYTNKIIILDSTVPNPITGQASATIGDIRIYLTYPVIANRTYSLYIKSYSQTITAARFIPCQGNV